MNDLERMSAGRGDRNSEFFTKLFTKRSSFDFSAAEVFDWHERKGAIERLSPPWDPIEALSVTNGIKPGSKVNLRMKAGPFYYQWRAAHTDYKKNLLFRDEQESGPFAKWTHTHKFDPGGPDFCFLEDSIEYRPRLSFLGGFLLTPFIQKQLNRIFSYRHETTAADLTLHKRFADSPRKKIVISGAGGLIGKKLVPFLTTGGHAVSRLTRRPPVAEDEIFWDPEEGVLNPDDLKGADAVIHLAGENVGNARWTDEQKAKILRSRVKGTRLLTRVISTLNPAPEVFISASATGYYGDTGEKTVSENTEQGEGFLAYVCGQWEKEARAAAKKGIRTALMRIGMVVTPEGGALKKLLLPFKLGLGGRIGSGKQFISWISMDDALAAFYWALMNKEVSGPVNVAAPNPATNSEFTKTLASVLWRPALLPLPTELVKRIFGQMGEEALLIGTRAIPRQLLKTGFYFRHLQLEEALRHALGK